MARVPPSASVLLEDGTGNGMSSGHTRRRVTLAESHLARLIENGTASSGPDPCAMWMSSVDARTGRPAPAEGRAPGFTKRVYRNIDAPLGSTLYWDQPLVVAAHAVSRATGDERYSRAADEYVRAFLERCVARNGVFLWGNHYYWDASCGAVVRFKGGEEPVPCDMAGERGERGELHEARPIPPAWEALWRVDPGAVERCVRALGRMHVFDMDSGGFNRHADGGRSHAFLESGGILAESLAWLSRKAGDRSLAEAALRVARYSFRHRGERTGLVRNNPTGGRWDSLVSTTEVGLWAGSLLRAADYSDDAEFGEMAGDAVAAYLRFGWDEEARRYHGMVRVEDGSPVLRGEPPAGETIYQPGEHADLWEPLFPRHDYPLALAETCAALFEQTGGAEFEEAAKRLAALVSEETPARGARGAYAEHYGRAVHFLCRAADALGDASLRDRAHDVADEAVDVLFTGEMFRSHPGEDRCDAVDGVGFLLLALIYLDAGREPDGMGFGF